jgi:hypothetical protein
VAPRDNDDWYDRWVEKRERDNKLIGALRDEGKPGRVEVVPCQFGWYWHAYVGDQRVNGGLCELGEREAARDARFAISTYRDSLIFAERRAFLRDHYWDTETQQWLKHGEVPLPPVS